MLTLISCADLRVSPNQVSSTNSAIVLTAEPPHRRDVSNVNGRIVIGSGMNVNDVRNVNGRIVVESGATTGNLRTVNGRVNIEGDVSINGNVNTVNGGITALSGGEINGSAGSVNGRVNFSNVSVGIDVTTTNGSIDLTDVTIGENIETTNGNISLENSVVERDLIVRERRWNNGLFGLFGLFDRDPKVIISPDSHVRGSLIAREKIRLYVHETASVDNIIGANPISYSGQRP